MQIVAPEMHVSPPVRRTGALSMIAAWTAIWVAMSPAAAAHGVMGASSSGSVSITLSVAPHFVIARQLATTAGLPDAMAPGAICISSNATGRFDVLVDHGGGMEPAVLGQSSGLCPSGTVQARADAFVGGAGRAPEAGAAPVLVLIAPD